MCFVVRLQTNDGRARAAVVRDESETGVFLLTHGALDIGDTVELELVPLASGDPTPRVRGRVVRSRTWDAGDLWRLAVAVHLDGLWSPDLVVANLAAP